VLLRKKREAQEDIISVINYTIIIINYTIIYIYNMNKYKKTKKVKTKKVKTKKVKTKKVDLGRKKCQDFCRNDYVPNQHKVIRKVLNQKKITKEHHKIRNDSLHLLL